MKKLDRNSLLRLSLVALVILAVAGLAWKQAEDKLQTEFSASNTGLSGLSLFTRTLEDLGYETKYSTKPLRDLEGDALWTLTLSSANAASELAAASILDQAGNGRRILLLYPGDLYEYGDFSESGYVRDGDVSLTSVDEIDYTISKWHDKSGSVIITASLDPLVNLFIADDPAYAYLLLQQIHPLMNGTGISHDEYYLYWQPIGTSLWLDMPLWLKMIVCQFLIVLIAFILFRGKRFGKAKRFLEEEEPEEDQYPRAVGELYHQGGHWELALESHWHRFLEELGKQVPTGRKADAGNWLELWNGAGLSGGSEALRTDALLRKLAEESASIRMEESAASRTVESTVTRMEESASIRMEESASSWTVGSASNRTETRQMKKRKARMRKEAVLLLRELEEIMGKRGTAQWNTKKSNPSSNT